MANVRYTAASVKHALDRFIVKKGLYCEDLAKMASASFEPTAEQPACRRNVAIFLPNKKTLYTTIAFLFPVSETNPAGYVDAGDNGLSQLLDKGHISEYELEKVRED